MNERFFTELFATAIALGAPLLLAALGELVSELGGVINIGLEAMMLAGAFAGVLGAFLTGSVILAFACAIIGGLLVATIHGVACLSLRANQVVSGVALNILILGMTSFLLAAIIGPRVGRAVANLAPIHVPGLIELPLIGPALFGQNTVTYIAYLAVPVMWFALYRTTVGLGLRAVGELPSAAESLGLNVILTRWIALGICGAMAGVGGGLLALGGLGFFTNNITAGRGFIALAAVVFGRWNPFGVLLAVMLFSLADAFQIGAQALGILHVPYQLLISMPYVVTVLALTLPLRAMRPPSALGVNYERN